jgi:hypothetical protein
MPKPEMSYMSEDIDNPNNGETSQLSYMSKDDAADDRMEKLLSKSADAIECLVNRMDAFAKRHGYT